VRADSGEVTADAARRASVCGVTDSLRVCDVSEEQLLAQIFPLLPAAPSTIVGPGDDAAVIVAADGRFVVSTDVLVADRHFIRSWSSGFDVGWRAAMQNLADIAAMGARPTALVVSLVLPPTESVEWVLDLARGLAAACERHGAGVVGGDLSSGDLIVVAVTVHGDLAGGEPVLRSGARPGDVVAHAGVLGRSAAGLALLRSGANIATEDRELIAAYLRPNPPLGSGVDARAAGATALLDVSDGLLRDAGRVARASKVTVDLIDPSHTLAVDRAAVAHAAQVLGADPIHWVLTGGEDHGLLATFPAGTDLPSGFRVIGAVHAPADGDGLDGVAGVTVNGAAPTESISGWDHFAGR
jgi:thiamine-monophosphate kinase